MSKPVSHSHFRASLPESDRPSKKQKSSLQETKNLIVDKVGTYQPKESFKIWHVCWHHWIIWDDEHELNSLVFLDDSYIQGGKCRYREVFHYEEAHVKLKPNVMRRLVSFESIWRLRKFQNIPWPNAIPVDNCSYIQSDVNRQDREKI